MTDEISYDQLVRAYNLQCGVVAKQQKELERAYRCIRGFWTATKKGEVLDKTALYYHSPTIAAACRFVADGSLEGSEYFIGKHVSLMHEALDR